MQTQIEKALCDIARELREIRRILEKKEQRGPLDITLGQDKLTLNAPWKPLEDISNNPEAHGWCQDEQG